MTEPLRPPLETLSGLAGAAAIGWLAERTLYARLEGDLSSELGAAYASRLHALARSRPSFDYFVDARALRTYDLLARSAFIRVVLTERRRFRRLTILTWAEGIGAAGRAMIAAIGGEIEMLVDGAEFDRRLIEAAPGCLRLIGSSMRRDHQPTTR